MVLTLALQMMVALYPAPREPAVSDKGPGYLGIRFSAANGEGLLISEVQDKSPAQMYGLQADDVILKYDGRAINDSTRFVKIVASIRPGTILPLEIRRGNKTMTLKVKIGVRPDDFPDPVPEADELPMIEISPKK